MLKDKECRHPPERLYAWIVSNVPVIDSEGHVKLGPYKDGPIVEEVMVVACCDCGSVLKGLAVD